MKNNTKHIIGLLLLCIAGSFEVFSLLYMFFQEGTVEALASNLQMLINILWGIAHVALMFGLYLFCKYKRAS